MVKFDSVDLAWETRMCNRNNFLGYFRWTGLSMAFSSKVTKGPCLEMLLSCNIKRYKIQVQVE